MTEFFARYHLGNSTQDIDNLLAGRMNFSDIRSAYARIQLLSQAQLASKFVKTHAQTSNRNNPSGLRKFLEDQNYNRFCERVKTKYLIPLELDRPSLPDTSLLPGSWALQIQFSLRKPYISSDDVDLSILDNPLKKEWLFKIPYIAPSQWKGALRSAIRQLKGYTTWEDELGDDSMMALFGNPKGIEEHALLKKGRLLFYPTYFYAMGLDIINPHGRRSGTGTTPIAIESVPINSVGDFILLYFPVDSVGNDPDEIKNEAIEALGWISKGLHQMFVVQGFGAKTSSGFGTAHDDFPKPGELRMNSLPTSIQITSFSELAADDFTKNLFEGGKSDGTIE